MYWVLAYFESVLGIINACPPVLKPVFNKAHHSIRRNSGQLDKRSFLKSGSIAIVMRAGQILHSLSAQRAERDGINSIVRNEGLEKGSDGNRVHVSSGKTSGGKSTCAEGYSC